jgi:hypothetical protein
VAAIAVITMTYYWKQHARRELDEEIADIRKVKSEAATNDGPLLSRKLTDKDIFEQPPPSDECPICFLRLPIDERQVSYFACCGKIVCKGCVCADEAANNRTICAFCRAPTHASDGKLIERLKKRAESDDAVAMRNLGCYYYDGRYGLP